MKNVPCRYCEKRSLGCHGRCEKYIEYKRDCETIRAHRFEQRQTDVELADMREEHINKIRR